MHFSKKYAIIKNMQIKPRRTNTSRPSTSRSGAGRPTSKKPYSKDRGPSEYKKPSSHTTAPSRGFSARPSYSKPASRSAVASLAPRSTYRKSWTPSTRTSFGAVTRPVYKARTSSFTVRNTTTHTASVSPNNSLTKEIKKKIASINRKTNPVTRFKKAEVVEFTFPARINRYLAHKGFSTRRGADDIVEKGLVTINGTVAKIGDKVVETDVVEVSENVLAKAALRHRYVAYHKPVGVSTDTQHDSRSIESELPALRGLYPLGRLDKDSHGLILLTNDGRLTERLLHPSREHEKEYLVRVDKRISDTFIRHLERGILIETYKTKPAKARRAGETIFYITLTEGKKHQIRRMCASEGYQVIELQRVRIMNIKLNDLKEGSYRDIAGEELLTFLKAIGL